MFTVVVRKEKMLEFKILNVMTISIQLFSFLILIYFKPMIYKWEYGVIS